MKIVNFIHSHKNFLRSELKFPTQTFQILYVDFLNFLRREFLPS